jgi:hypothetical protein
MIDLIIKLQPVIAAGGALSFVVIYLLYSKWWKSAMGRHMMSFMAGCFVVLVLAIFIRFFPHSYIQPARMIGWSIVIFIMWWRAWVAFKVLVLKRYEGYSGDE